MPNIFKALATISVWALFINGMGSIIWTSVDSFARVGGMAGERYNFADVAWMTNAIVSLFLAAAVMKIRKELE